MKGKPGIPATHREMYAEVKRKSRNGVEYTNYKKVVVPLVWEKKNEDNRDSQWTLGASS